MTWQNKKTLITWMWGEASGKGNEENIFINGQPVTALLDTGSQVTHVSHDYCVANGIDINPIAKLVNIEALVGIVLHM